VGQLFAAKFGPDQHKSPLQNVKIWLKLRYFGIFAPYWRYNTPIQMKLSLKAETTVPLTHAKFVPDRESAHAAVSAVAR